MKSVELLNPLIILEEENINKYTHTAKNYIFMFFVMFNNNNIYREKKKFICLLYFRGF